jgi:hypothetical protein
MIVGFVSAGVFTTALTAISTLFLASYQANETDKREHVAAFVKSTEEFDPLVRAYMTDLLESKDTSAAAKPLENNVQQQFTLLHASEAYLEPSSRKDALAYESTLVGIESALDKGPTILTGHDLVQGIANAAAQREVVIAALRHSAGLRVAKP